ncbi:MAG: hypothetical protein KDK48_04735, partial [Chlamydiia bacterium]|nr:hypothetical protein [Chlamydiia bacterium]
MPQNKKPSKIVPISEALEALSTLAEINDSELEKRGAAPLPLSERVSRLVEDIDTERVRHLFDAVYAYVDEKVREQPQDLEKVRSVMTIVGAAAKNLDKYGSLFHLKSSESVTKLAEYRRLQDLYTRKVERQVDTQMLGQWILGLTGLGPSKKEIRKARMRKEEQTKHVYVDLEMVKRDNEYELLLMRKEDGSRFFSPRLIRNIRIVSDFGAIKDDETDVFRQVGEWRQAICQLGAAHMIKTLSLTMRRYYHEVFRHKARDYVGHMNKAFMALFLAAQTRPEAEGAKTSVEYFADFQYYLRLSLNTRYYQKLLLFPPKKHNHIALCMLAVTQHVCRAFYLHLNVMNELYFRTLALLHEAEQLFPMTTLGEKERGALVWSRLAYDYAEIVKALRRHESGPLKRVLETLKAGSQTAFDPLLQNNLPHNLFELGIKKAPCRVLRLPCPTRQTQINKAVVTDEFKNYLLSTSRTGSETHHLLINLQDRTAWREFARCKAVEQIGASSVFDHHLTVATFATDTNFYHQSGPYEGRDSYEEFESAFLEQLKDSSSGYLFEEKHHKKALKFAMKAIPALHRLFFDGEKFLSKKDRQSFITLFHVFMTLFLVDLVKPTSLSFSCKDAIDMGESTSVLLYLMIHMFSAENMSERAMDYVKAMLYGPSILIRERAPLPEVINRMFNALQKVEGKKEKMGFHTFSEAVKEELKGLIGAQVLTAPLSAPIYDWQP